MDYRQASRIQWVSNHTPARSVVTLDTQQDMIPFDRIKCADLREIGKAWQEYARIEGEPLPRWRMFRVSDFIRTIERLCVLRVEDDRIDDLEFSLYGSHASEYIGNGRRLVLQNLRTDPLRQNNYIDIRDRAERAIINERPQYARKSLSWENKAYIEYEVLMLPFMAEDGTQRLLQPFSARIRSEIEEKALPRLEPVVVRKPLSAANDEWPFISSVMVAHR
jgi:hypothetical protein